MTVPLLKASLQTQSQVKDPTESALHPVVWTGEQLWGEAIIDMLLVYKHTHWVSEVSKSSIG